MRHAPSFTALTSVVHLPPSKIGQTIASIFLVKVGFPHKSSSLIGLLRNPTNDIRVCLSNFFFALFSDWSVQIGSFLIGSSIGDSCADWLLTG